MAKSGTKPAANVYREARLKASETNDRLRSRESTAEERDEQEFYADPIVSTIRMHLAEAEDLADDPTTAYWVVTGDDFIAEIKRSTGYTIASTDALGRKVKKLEQKLMDYERIKRDVKRIDGTRGYKFYRIPEFDDPS